jgi:hypothetical protein
VPLREQIREWEQDEQRKMEQERQALRGARRNLDHLKRGDLRASDEEMDQSSGSEDSGSDDQDFLNERRCANSLKEGDSWARCFFNNNTFTWSGPSGVLGCTGQRRKRRLRGGAYQVPIRCVG